MARVTRTFHRLTRRAAFLCCGVAIAGFLAGWDVAHADTAILSASQDAWIDQGSQTTNAGTATTLHVKGRASSKRRTLVQFDLSSLPACVSVDTATLRLRVDSNSLSTNVSHSVHRILASWTEGGVTWLSRDGSTTWSAGGLAGGTDMAVAATASAATGTGAGFVEWNVKPDIVSFVSGAAANNGWLLKHSGEGGTNNNDNNTIVQYASRENATAANRPQLVIGFTECTPIPTETPTEIPTDTPTAAPTDTATAVPTDTPTEIPTDTPTAAPTDTATAVPTDTPTEIPTDTPTAVPTDTATAVPTNTPTEIPTDTPTAAPTATATAEPLIPSATPSPTASPAPICAPVPDVSGCLKPADPGKGLLLISNTSPTTAKIIWKWIHGEETSTFDFGNPVEGPTSYSLCLYDEIAGAPVLMFEASVPPGGTCAGKPCWKPIGTRGFKYKDSDKARHGIFRIQLKAGAEGKAKVMVQGKGPLLAAPSVPLDQDPTVTAVLTRKDLLGDTCWSNAFSAPATRNKDGVFKDKAN